MKTWNNIDKKDWPRGEWDDEPDKAHWINGEVNLDCLIVRGPSGALCGYVGVPEGHPCFQKDYDSIDVDCHGGLTFADLCREADDPGRHICHEKECAANDKVWWLGFDCAHAWDVAPKYDHSFGYDSMYRSFSYVKDEVNNLAKQLAEIKKTPNHGG